MRISDHLIELVLSGGGTEEEKRLVMEFFKANPEELAQYLTEESWEKFEAGLWPEAPRAKMLQTIENSVGKVPAPVRELGEGQGIKPRRSFGERYGWVAVASVVLVVGLVVLFYRKKEDKAKGAIVPAISIVRAPEREMITNTALKPKIIALPDGSKVKLAANSSISFNDPFIDNRRDLYLKGEAVFTVEKDAVRPFIVHSRGITTTVLGTVFSVDDRGGLFTTVHLYSGRVVVKKDVGEGKAFAAVYLSPGERLLLNNADFSVQVRKDEKAAVAKAPVLKPKPQVLKFTVQPLTEIFNQLQQQFAITISYDKDSLKNMDFTGVFNSDKETLESFLSTLCDLNELILKKTGSNSFSIQTK